MSKTLNDEYQTRLNRLKKIKEEGVNPYPERFDKSQSVAEILNLKMGSKVKTAGRLITFRDMGKIAFGHIQDDTGKMQIVLKQDELGKDKMKGFIKSFDSGDFVGAEGEVFKTQKGEISILVKKYVMLGKALRPLPEKFHGLKDQEAKYRQRYLDLISNKDTFDRFVFRSNFIKALREFYWQRGFLEVETPTLMHSATGATAKPYKTHNDAFDVDLVLRISHELPLKELIVGGFEKIFEIGKAFRNEGYDPSHLPEHTHLEHYVAYWNFEDNIKFTEEMFNFLFKELSMNKKMDLIGRDGKKHKVNFKTPWPKVNFVDLIKKDTDIDVMKYSDAKILLKDIKAQKIKFEGMEKMSLVGLVDNLYKKVSRPKIINPTILHHFPKYLQPLARVSDKDENVVDQFQLVVNGWEIVKAYSELVDPIDQKQRFDEQKKASKAGEEEVMEGDEGFITALEHGAPPISGWGMGVDRLLTLLTEQDNLRDVVLSPLMRPKEVEKKDKSKEVSIATVVLNSSAKLKPWQVMNTVAHLNASFAARNGRSLFYQDALTTKDGKNIKFNIQHAIMIKEADAKAVSSILDAAKDSEVGVYEFIENMIETTNDKKILSDIGGKKYKDVKFLGILIFGPKSVVDKLTNKAKLIK